MNNITDHGAEVVGMSKQDIIAAWSLMERLVVSLHRMGSYYSTSGPDVPLSPDQQQKMLTDLDAFLDSDFVAQVARVRRMLSEYLPDEEAEAISEQMEKQGLYWRGKN